VEKVMVKKHHDMTAPALNLGIATEEYLLKVAEQFTD